MKMPVGRPPHARVCSARRAVHGRAGQARDAPDASSLLRGQFCAVPLRDAGHDHGPRPRPRAPVTAAVSAAVHNGNGAGGNGHRGDVLPGSNGAHGAGHAVRGTVPPGFYPGTVPVDVRSRRAAESESFHWLPAVLGLSAWAKLDDAMEEYRLMHRSAFGHAAWHFHRSSFRYVSCLLSMHKSKLIQGLALPVAMCAAVAIATGLFNLAGTAGLLPAALAALPIGRLSLAPFTVAAPALSLLLVFRTNSAYARFWEGRTAWATVVRTCRDLARQTVTWVPVPGLRAALLRHVIVYTKALKVHLREGEDIAAEVDGGAMGAGLLSPDELAMLQNAACRPLHVLTYMTALVARARAEGMSEKCQMALDAGLTSLQGAGSTCDKLFNTPIPTIYTKFTKRVLMVFCATLPLALWEACRWSTVPLVVCLSVMLLGIEDIGVQIEEPFSILALERMCEEVEANVIETNASADALLSLTESAALAGTSNGILYGQPVNTLGGLSGLGVAPRPHAPAVGPHNAVGMAPPGAATPEHPGAEEDYRVDLDYRV